MKILRSTEFLFLFFLLVNCQCLANHLLSFKPTQSALSIPIFLIASHLSARANSQVIFITPSTGGPPNPPPVIKTVTLNKKYDEYVSSFKPFQNIAKGSPEYTYRTLIYDQNVVEMESHNKKTDKKYQMGLNQFSDVEPKQFKALYAKLIIPDTIIKNVESNNTVPIPKKNQIYPILVNPPPNIKNSTNSTNIVTTSTVPKLTSSPDGLISILNSFNANLSAASNNATPSTASSNVNTTAGSVDSNNSLSRIQFSANVVATGGGTSNVQSSVSTTTSVQALNSMGASATTSVTTSTSTSSTGNASSAASTSTTTTTSTPTIPFNINIPTNVPNINLIPYTIPPNITIDWTCKASPVINQGVCGSCYAIASLESIYITLAMYDQTILPLSIQQIVSCGQPTNGVYGCGGGYFISSFEYTKVNGTGRMIMYPYSNQAINQGITTACNSTIVNSAFYIKSKVKIRQANFIPYRDCFALVTQLKTQSIAVSIATSGLQFYVNGTYNNAGESPNHGVTLVGYTPGQGYKIKNSWGSSWGDAGYAFISETTGVCDYAMYPVTGFQENTPLSPCPA